MNPKLSVCIPAYNRPHELSELLDSLAQQPSGDWDVIICDDCSPRSSEIEARVNDFARHHPAIALKYVRNETTLGYDRNLRRLIDIARGDYCLFMGDDDLLVSGALEKILSVLAKHNVGFILRAWRSINNDSQADVEQHRYFPQDLLFKSGTDSVVALFRRSVFISGLVFSRRAALECATDRFDGTLLYQLHLISCILPVMDSYYSSEPIVLRRLGGTHFFGTSKVESGKFAPNEVTPDHSVQFVRGLLDIARAEDTGDRVLFFEITRDVARNAYPLLEIQAKSLGRIQFMSYANRLASLGLWRYVSFWLWYAALMLFGPGVIRWVIRFLKTRLGYTPNLTRSAGLPAAKSHTRGEIVR